MATGGRRRTRVLCCLGVAAVAGPPLRCVDFVSSCAALRVASLVAYWFHVKEEIHSNRSFFSLDEGSPKATSPWDWDHPRASQPADCCRSNKLSSPTLILPRDNHCKPIVVYFRLGSFGLCFAQLSRRRHVLLWPLRHRSPEEVF